MAQQRVMHSFSPARTRRIAKIFAQTLCDVPRRRAAIIFLQGNLGAGKTTFVRGFLSAYGINPHGASPTFVLMKHYPVRQKGACVSDVYHIDAYRLSSEQDVKALRLGDAFRDPRVVVLVEWPEKVAGRTLRATHRVRFSYGARSTERLLSFS